MRELGKIGVYAVTMFVLGCLLAPPLYWLGRWVAASGMLPDLPSMQLAAMPFARFFNRAVLVAAAVLLWPFARWMGLKGWTELGLAPNSKRGLHLGLGLAIGLSGLWLAAAARFGLGRATYNEHFSALDLAGAALTAATVALIEESLFRGALLGLLRRSLRWPTALATLSALFAALHFLKPPPGVSVPAVDWLSGFRLFPSLFWQYGDPRLVSGGLLTLFLVGVALGYTVVKTRSLYMAIGLHAGWVAGLRSFRVLTHGAGEPTFWFGQDPLTGLVPVLLMVVTLGLVAWLLERPLLRGAP